jgi:hypothetical protein
MSDEGESINENINQSSEEEVPGVSDYESDTVSPVTEEEGEETEEIATEEPLEEQGERLETSTIEQPSPSQLEVQAKPIKQKQKTKTVNRIQNISSCGSILKFKEPPAPTIIL